MSKRKVVTQDQIANMNCPFPPEPNPLTTGSERVIERLYQLDLIDDVVGVTNAFKADTGVKALVQGMKDIAFGIPGPIGIARAALKTWETGK